MESSQPTSSDTTSTNDSGWSAKKKLFVLVSIPVIIGLVAATALYVRFRTDRAVALSVNTAYVDITSNGYSPKTIKIQKGQLISWRNTEKPAHSLAADTQALEGFETTEPLNQGDSYTYIFDKSGVFKYYDPNNAKEFVGTIIVE